ncbi:MAG: hypothetical protein K6F50_04970 [Kiritimatiellae bacterium]|nr:hypothetical protein [Kiritimatiellia bacterium]
MGVVLTLLAGVAMLAVPVCIIVKVMTLFATRNDGRVGKGGSATPWSDNLYSAAKRATFAWVAVTLFCVVAYGILGFSGAVFLPWSGHFWMLVAVPVLAFAWGLLRPRIYADGVDRERNGRGDAWIVLSFLLLLVFLPVFFVTRGIVPFKHVDKDTGMIQVRSDKWDDEKFSMFPIACRIVPPKAFDIEFDFSPGVMRLGALAELRCKVEKGDLIAFAESCGYEFQSESIDRNSCKNGMGDVTFADHVWRKYNKGLLPIDFLAYNCRYANAGGVSFLYDVAAGTLYAQWSSN